MRQNKLYIKRLIVALLIHVKIDPLNFLKTFMWVKLKVKVFTASRTCNFMKFRVLFSVHPW